MSIIAVILDLMICISGGILIFLYVHEREWAVEALTVWMNRSAVTEP